MSALANLTWNPSKDTPIPTGAPGERLWVKLGWASFLWLWHDEEGLWAADGWSGGREQESVAPGAARRDMAWARPDPEGAPPG